MFSIQGDKQLMRKLKKLEGKELKKKIRTATRAGAKEILPTAKSLAPKLTGRLAAALKVRSLKRSRVQQGHTIQIDTNKNPEAFYGGFQEFGTAHIKANEFLKRAAQLNANRVLTKTLDLIRKGILEIGR